MYVCFVKTRIAEGKEESERRDGRNGRKIVGRKTRTGGKERKDGEEGKKRNFGIRR